MLIGILSDSHNHSDPVRRAMALFDLLGVSKIIHCGDVGGTGVFDELVGRDLTFVWGNTDCPGAGLFAYLETVGVAAPDRVPARRRAESASGLGGESINHVAPAAA